MRSKLLINLFILTITLSCIKQEASLTVRGPSSSNGSSSGGNSSGGNSALPAIDHSLPHTLDPAWSIQLGGNDLTEYGLDNSYDTSGNENCFGGTQLTNDGKLICMGETNKLIDSSANNDMLALKIDMTTRNINALQISSNFATSSVFVSDVGSNEFCKLAYDSTSGSSYCFSSSVKNFVGNSGFSQNGSNIIGIKFNTDLSILWSTQLDPTANNPLTSFKTLPTNYAIGNEFFSASDGDLKVDSSGNVYICGFTNGNFIETKVNSYEGFVIKFNSSGQVLWAKQYQDLDFGLCKIGLNSLNELYIAFSTSSVVESGATQGGIMDLAIVKINSNDGSQDWVKQYGPSRIAGATDVENLLGFVIDSKNDLYLAAYTRSGIADDVPDTHPRLDAIVIKISSDGETIKWMKQFGAQTISDYATSNGLTNYSALHGNFGVSLALDNYDQVYVGLSEYFSSYGDNNAGAIDISLAKLNSTNGDIYWMQHFGQNNKFSTSGDNSGTDFIQGIVFDADNNMYITGQTSGGAVATNGGGNDIFFAKFDAP